MLVERLCRQTGLSETQLERFAASASKRYKTYPIPKRDGSERLISQPSRELKALQRWVLRAVFKTFPVHGASTAYFRGASIRKNIEAHVGSRFTLRMDFQDFFPSFQDVGVADFLARRNVEGGLGLTRQDIEFVVRIVCRYGALTIGAPSSPLLTNAIMFDFDQRLSVWCSERNLIYTRYADDLFVSSRVAGGLDAVPAVISRCAREFEYAELKINRDKTKFLSRKYKRAITGLVLTPEGRISIGRGRKREIKALVHLYRGGDLDAEKVAYLRGLLAFVSDVEPEFRWSLGKKFGEPLISEVEGRRPELAHALNVIAR